EVLLQAPVGAGGEQGLEDLFPPRGVGVQGLAKAPLRQQHHLAELVQVEAEEPADLAIHVGGPGGQRLPPAVAPTRELRARGLRDETVPGASARAGLFRRAARAVPLGTERELEHDLGRPVVRRMVAAHLRGSPLAPGGIAVERDTDGVEDARLARARGPVDEEERIVPQRREIEVLAAGKGAEGLHRERERLHDPASRSPRAIASMRSATYLREGASSGSPATSATKLPNRSISSTRACRGAARAPPPAASAGRSIASAFGYTARRRGM